MIMNKAAKSPGPGKHIWDRKRGKDKVQVLVRPRIDCRLSSLKSLVRRPQSIGP